MGLGNLKLESSLHYLLVKGAENKRWLTTDVNQNLNEV